MQFGPSETFEFDPGISSTKRRNTSQAAGDTKGNLATGRSEALGAARRR